MIAKKLHTSFFISLLALPLLLSVFFVVSAPKPTYAAIDKQTAEGLIDQFVGTCKVGAPGGKGSDCYELATRIIKEVNCGQTVTLASGKQKLLYDNSGKNSTIYQVYSGGVEDCRAKVLDLPGLTKEEALNAKAEDNAQKACEEYTEQRDKDSKGVSVYGACKEGYTAGYTGSKSRADFCNQFSSKRRTACADAYSQGSAARPGGDGNDPNGINSDISYEELPKATANDKKIDTIANIAFGIAGSLAMLFVIVGGVRYTMSQGDSQKVAQARNTIMYAVAGLVVTISAFAIVRFVLERAV